MKFSNLFYKEEYGVRTFRLEWLVTYVFDFINKIYGFLRRMGRSPRAKYYRFKHANIGPFKKAVTGFVAMKDYTAFDQIKALAEDVVRAEDRLEEEPKNEARGKEAREKLEILLDKARLLLEASDV